MSAETLRLAATKIREERWDAFHLTVADWLEEVAGWREEGLGLMPATNLADAWGCIERQAITVARAYLGGAA